MICKKRNSESNASNCSLIECFIQIKECSMTKYALEISVLYVNFLLTYLMKVIYFPYFLINFFMYSGINE